MELRRTVMLVVRCLLVAGLVGCGQQEPQSGVDEPNVVAQEPAPLGDEPKSRTAGAATSLPASEQAALTETSRSEEEPPQTADTHPRAWTPEEAMGQVNRHPHNAYLQYVALQLARAESPKRFEQIISQIGRVRPSGDIDLFGMFTGADAIQLSLQLDALGATNDNQKTPPHLRSSVRIDTLAGPTVRSHPWEEMLAEQLEAGKNEEVSSLAMCVPDDRLFVLFRSIDKLVEAEEESDLWTDWISTVSPQTATTRQTMQRMITQLAVRTDPLARPFYNMAVEQFAITAGDLYFGEGSDVTLLFKVKQPVVFKIRMDSFLDEAAKSRRDAVRAAGEMLGVPYVHLATPDRTVHVFSAWPQPDLHVRSNSKVGLQSVLETIVGKTPDGKPVQRLGETAEFKYMRTLMPLGAEEEDGFVYFSDPFIRRLVSAEMKLTERRRMQCYNYMRMIGHAATLYLTQLGKHPGSFEAMVEAGCAPLPFGQGRWQCPCGGSYSLEADGTTGVCSHHGHVRQLVPCGEIPLSHATGAEAEAYRRFVTEYGSNWPVFDPIAVRIQITPKQYRMETIILPLLQNRGYLFISILLRGDTEPLDAWPVPHRNAVSLAAKLGDQWQGLVVCVGPLNDVLVRLF